MSDYISREAAISRIFEAISYHFASQTGLERAINYLREIPAADVREVVLCRDCKHRGNTPDCPFCWLADTRMGDEHFCSFGEKREES